MKGSFICLSLPNPTDSIPSMLLPSCQIVKVICLAADFNMFKGQFKFGEVVLYFVGSDKLP